MTSASTSLANLETATRIAESDDDLSDGNSHEDAGFIDDSLSNESTASGEYVGSDEEISCNKNKIQRLVLFMVGQIQSLYKVIALLGQSGVQDESFHSVAKDTSSPSFIKLDQDNLGSRLPKASDFLISRMGKANALQRQQPRDWNETLERNELYEYCTLCHPCPGPVSEFEPTPQIVRSQRRLYL